MFTMKLLLSVSLLLLSELIPLSCSSPVVAGTSHKNNPLIQRTVANTCSSSWIQAAESRANKGPHQTISSLCSSLQNKYKTVTHSVYTKTVTPKTTIDKATTAPHGIVTATRTSEITQQSTETDESTSVTDITAAYTETTVVETDTVTVTGVLSPKRLRNQYPCQQIESLLTLSANSATPFCSCYNTGPTSTKTVTDDTATTAPEVYATDYTKTVTLTPSTAYTTVDQTTTAVTTVESEIVITSTVSTETTVSVTDIVTSTVAPAPALPTGLLQVQNPASPYNGFYAYLDITGNGAGPILLQSSISNDQVFNIDGSGYLNGGEYTAIINYYDQSNNEDDNLFYMLETTEIGEYAEYRPICSADPVTQQLSCNDLANSGDLRTMLQICPSDSGTFGDESVGTPFLVFDAGIDYGCELALLFFTNGQ